VESARIRLDRLDAAVLDLDGVVTDTARVHAAAWADLFDSVLVGGGLVGGGLVGGGRVGATGAEPFDPEADYLRYVDGKPRADGVVSFLASRGIVLPVGDPSDPPTAVTVCGLARRKDDLFRERLRREGARAFPGSVAFTRQLRAAGKRVAVVSASRNCRDVLAAAGLVGLFDVIVDGVTAAELGLPGKPDPATFLLATRRLGTVPGRTLLIEDALAGIEAARRGGFDPIVAVDRRRHAESLRRAGADIVVTDLADLTLVGDDPGSHPTWSVVRDESGARTKQRAHDALFALSDGTVGVRGNLETGAPGRAWLTLVAGAFGLGADGDGMVRLLPGPSLTALVSPSVGASAPAMRRTLDLRSGVLECAPAVGERAITTIRFVSVARPGLVAVRAEGAPDQHWPDRPLEAPRLEVAETLAAAFTYAEGGLGARTWWAETRSDRARVSAVAQQRSGTGPNGAWLERLSVFSAGTSDARAEAEEVLEAASREGFDALLAEHRRVWAQRWDAADIEIDGDDRTQEAIRFALFHLMSCAPTSGEAGVAARGLTGLAYAGHVFWDSDVFVMPVLAATLPEAARTMIEYRVRRLGAARRAAAASGRSGARFPWESADTGDDVTPVSARDHDGEIVEIRTGSHEEHITADVAWAVFDYVDWTGDVDILEGAAGELVTETARYWASRIRVGDDGRAHLDAVMGPDEYHEVVDDNAFTNIMVRWLLRRAATMVAPAEPEQASLWRGLADALTDGFDPSTGRHEQFAGFWQLEPLRITDIADVPIAADVLLGSDRVAHAQVIKQPDVLMAHHLVPDELPPGSLAADLDFYLPRTAHGSSLSPAICASLLARGGRPDDAIALFDIAARLDLDDLTDMTGGGLHLATFGGLWQAVVFGFGGVRVVGGVLLVQPALPARWSRLRLRLRFVQTAIRLDLGHDRVGVKADGPVRLEVCGVPLRGSADLVREGDRWTLR
jgi:HAD superfamily hydrolase (TIGR01509 family)